MTEKIVAIVLDITRHSDKLDIVSVYSRSHGRISLLSPAGTSKSARMRQARLQPLAVIEFDCHIRPNAELQRLGNFALHTVWSDLYFDPLKRLISLFISEFLNRLLRATMADQNMWDYIFNSLRLFDSMNRNISDFHIAFLASLLSFTGIQPDDSKYRPGMFFDLQAGVFSDTIPPHNDWLKGEEAALAAKICRLNFYNVKALKLNGAMRRRITEKILSYYAIHFPGTSNLRSPDIIHDIFN